MPFSLEAEEASRDGRYARALRRLVKKRRAIAQALPYAVAILGVADGFGLYGGNLCYVLENRPQRWLRILNLQETPDYEIVVDVPGLVGEAVPGADKGGHDYTFRLLHHAHGITSCLYSGARPDAEHWLLVFNARENKLLGTVRLDSAVRLFVRNTLELLYFGTHSELGADGYRRWVLRCIDLRDGQLSPRRIHLSKIAGYELGATVCFELIDGYFYGVTNTTTFEPEEIDWTSYYYCFRFLVDDPDPGRTEVMRECDSWRRQHEEGPIDDRWTHLKLEKDEMTGQLRIIESRREWLGGTSNSRRTCYATDVVFLPADAKTGGASASGRHGGYSLPDVPLAGLLESDDKPNYMPPPARLPQNVHAGDEGTAPFLYSKTYLRSYFYQSGTFLDLVDDPPPTAPYTQRLRLRALTRAANGVSLVPGRHTPGMAASGTGPGSEKEPSIISMWPPGPRWPGADARLDMLQRTMNPDNLCGAVRAMSDDRSIVYETGGAGEPKALIYISFDPAVRLAGMGHGGPLPGELIRNGIDDGASLPDVDPKGKGKAAISQAYTVPEAASRGDTQTAAGNAHVSAATSPAGLACKESPTLTLTASGGGTTWTRAEKAFHQEFSCKYSFYL